MDPLRETKMQLIIKEDKIRELESLLAERDRIIADLRTKLDKFQVIYKLISLIFFIHGFIFDERKYTHLEGTA